MIIRIFRVIVHDDQIDAFTTFLNETALPLMRQQEGLQSIIPCMPRPESPAEFCLIMTWDSLDALIAFVGPDWQEPHIHADEAAMVKDRFLHHYELTADP